MPPHEGNENDEKRFETLVDVASAAEKRTGRTPAPDIGSNTKFHRTLRSRSVSHSRTHNSDEYSPRLRDRKMPTPSPSPAQSRAHSPTVELAPDSQFPLLVAPSQSPNPDDHHVTPRATPSVLPTPARVALALVADPHTDINRSLSGEILTDVPRAPAEPSALPSQTLPSSGGDMPPAVFATLEENVMPDTVPAAQAATVFTSDAADDDDMEQDALSPPLRHRTLNLNALGLATGPPDLAPYTPEKRGTRRMSLSRPNSPARTYRAFGGGKRSNVVMVEAPLYSRPYNYEPDVQQANDQNKDMEDDLINSHPMLCEFRRAIATSMRQYWETYPADEMVDNRVSDLTATTKYSAFIFETIECMLKDHVAGPFNPFPLEEGLELAHVMIAQALTSANNLTSKFSKGTNSRAPSQETFSRRSSIEPCVPERILSVEIMNEIRNSPGLAFLYQQVVELQGDRSILSDNVDQVFEIMNVHQERLSKLEGGGVPAPRAPGPGRTERVGALVQPAVRASAQVPVQPKPHTAESDTAGVEKPRRSAPSAPRLETIVPIVSIPTVDSHQDLMGERGSNPIPDPGSFPSLKDANAKPVPKASVPKVSVVTDSDEGYTVATGSKKNKDKGKGKAKYIDIGRIDNIENAWKGGVPNFTKSIPNVDKRSITHALGANTSKAATNIQGHDLVKLIINTKGAKVTEKDRKALNPMNVDNRLHTVFTKVPTMHKFRTCGSEFNRHNNLVIAFPKGTDLNGFFIHEELFKETLGLPWPAKFERAVPSVQIKINSVPTGLGIEGKAERVFSFPQVLQEVRAAFPELTKAKIVQGPRWLTKGEPTGTKRSIMVAFENEDETIVPSILNKSTPRFMFGGTVTTAPFEYKAPLRLCEKCCSYDHDQKDCKSRDVVCARCSLKHGTSNHNSNCKLCQKELVLKGTPCPHKPKCNACKGEHEFNHPNCPKKKEYRPAITAILKREQPGPQHGPSGAHHAVADPAPKSPDVRAPTTVPAPLSPCPVSQVDPNAKAAQKAPGTVSSWEELVNEDNAARGSGSLPPFVDAEMFMDLEPTTNTKSHEGPHPASNRVGQD